MASPFTRYQSEQVPQINILPYTAGIAENLRKGIADFGAGVGKGIESLGLQRQAKEQAASLAQGVINKYMEQDGPEDDATGEVTYKISDTAPAHIKDIAKKVEKEPDGVFGLATTDLNKNTGRKRLLSLTRITRRRFLTYREKKENWLSKNFRLRKMYTHKT